MKARSGFTLTELLVGISLGAILVGAILPSLKTAQDTMKAAVCLGNMQQWGMAISLYTADHGDYYPYDGNASAPVDSIANTNAWYNVVPPYLNQPSLKDLYQAGKPPTPGTKSLWICPSGTNVTVSPTSAAPYFMYALSSCLHQSGHTNVGFRRSRMINPAATIIFCEEPEDIFPETNGQFDTVLRHFGGANFVMGDGHAEWIDFGNFCRVDNPGCTVPINANDSTRAGDWKSGVPYHWWFAPNIATASQ